MQVSDTFYITVDGAVLNISVEAWPMQSDESNTDMHEGAEASLTEVGEVVENFREYTLEFEEE